ncbi:hypothetical protein EST38_g3820 [Candolleomyces aberdarensis]|uniref:DUF6533 domain-containing protein n=1 Tax=Candolleomyces aberdarensis TaxID=2316362 RepID=A0A4Q2DS45_9AGAR|nr:hypothetical protein EST38_g3820 [Candolleomyces aberdarensis]
MSDQTDPAALQMLELEATALSARNGNLFWIAATVVVLYDHLSTLDLEIELVWKKKWSLVQVLFFINRYLPDAGFLYGAFVLVWLPYDKFEKVRQPDVLLHGELTFFFSSLHRIICMYRKRPTILYGLSAFWATNFIVGIVFCGFTMVTVNLPIFITNSVRTCVPLNLPSWSLANWCLMLAFDLTVFTFAVSEGIRYLRDNAEISDRHGGRRFVVVSKWAKQGRMIRILLRDSIVFPFIGLAISVFNILAWYVLPLGSIQYMMTITAAASPILGCRLILHLRDAYYRPFASEFTHGVSKTHERVHFNADDNTVQFSLRSMVASKINANL